MLLLQPDILAEAKGLSVAVSATGAVLGTALWLTGWWAHRFWIVLFTTLVAGVFALATPLGGVQPLVVALLLAVAAGVLALHLSRFLVFAAGGTVFWLAAHGVFPSWNEPLITFLVGGVVSYFLYRLCLMAVTSFAGTLLLGYSSLCLAEVLAKLDPAEWARQNGNWLNWACVGVALVGWLAQFLLESRRLDREEKRKQEEELAKEKLKEKEQREREKEQREKDKKKLSGWLAWGQGILRRAG
jgi:hypothetical protein